MHKRGLISEFGGTVLWIIILVVVLFAASRAISIVTTNNEENQAVSTMDRFANFLTDLQEGNSQSFVIYSPQGFYFVPSGTLICICERTDCKEGSKQWCKNVDKPIVYSGDAIRIDVGTIIVTKIKDSYSLAANIFQDASEPVQLAEGCSGELVTLDNGMQVKSSVKPILDKAIEIAKSYGKTLVVTSAYRTREDQEYWWNFYKRDTAKACDPATTKGTCPHMTGCAVDVCFEPICNTNQGELNNADTQLLQKIMAQAGFVRYSAEFWHFEYGTSRWQTCKTLGTDVC